MGTYDVTIYTASCDVGDCESLHGDPDDFSWDWSEFSFDCEDAAIRAGWTKSADGLLICKADDDEHQAARGIDPDDRPKPGPGQLVLALA